MVVRDFDPPDSGPLIPIDVWLCSRTFGKHGDSKDNRLPVEVGREAHDPKGKKILQVEFGILGWAGTDV